MLVLVFFFFFRVRLEEWTRDGWLVGSSHGFDESRNIPHDVGRARKEGWGCRRDRMQETKRHTLELVPECGRLFAWYGGARAYERESQGH